MNLKRLIRILLKKFWQFLTEKAEELRTKILDFLLILSLLNVTRNAIILDNQKHRLIVDYLRLIRFEQWLDVSLLVIVIALKLARHNSRTQNARARLDVTGTATDYCKNFQIECPTDAEFKEVLRMHFLAYPEGLFSPHSNSIREQKFKDWLRMNPSIWRVAKSNGVIAGYSCFLPITRDGWLTYKRGTGSPFQFPDEVFKVTSADDVVIYDLVTYIDSEFHNSLDYSEFYIVHLKQILQSFPKVFMVVTPAKSEETIANRHQMGFSMVGESASGYKIFELDLRRPDELTLSGQTLVSMIHS